jgi:hypothetical protein
MGKKKDKKKGGAKPAEAAGAVKLPKGLRKAGKAAKKLAEQPVVSEAVAAALLAAAAALRGGGTGTGKGIKAAGEGAADAPGSAGRQASMLGDALKAVAIDVARRTVAAWEESAKKAPKGSGEGR